METAQRSYHLTGPQRLDLGDPRRLQLRVVAGDVSVTAGEGPARLEVHGLEGPPLQVSTTDGTLTIGYDDLGWLGFLDGWHGHRRWVSLSLSVPPTCSVQLGVVSAAALIAGSAAPVEAKTVSGEVTVDALSGEVTITSVSGDVEARALRGPLRFDTVSGALTILDGAGPALRARTVSGEMTLDLSLDGGGPAELDLGSVSGSVVVRLPAATSATVDVRSTSGDLTSGFAGLAPSRSPGQRRLAGTLGFGAGRLRVRTVSGDVALLPRDDAG